MLKKRTGKIYFREKKTNDMYREIGFYQIELKSYI